MNRLLIIGAKGMGKVTLDCALAMNIYSKISFMTNDFDNIEVTGYEILEQDKTSLEYIKNNFDEAIVAAGFDNKGRLNYSKYLEKNGIKLATIIHPSAIISKFSKIKPGTIILANAVINPFANIGKACIINTSAIVEHDSMIEDGTHISPGAIITGRVHIGKETWICAGSVISNDLVIGNNVIVGAGAVVLEDVPNSVLTAGIPAKIIKKYE